MAETVFYAWQSDSEDRLNRYFIEAAAKDALKRITVDLPLEDSPRLDKDTQDENGMVAIAETIFRKIDRALAVLADVTLVGRITAKKPKDGEKKQLPKRTPNPNVMIELGYAARSRGWERVVAVMNTATGKPAQLPFDIHHRRWPITYELASWDASNRQAVRKKLSEELEGALRNLISSVGGTTGVSENRVRELRDDFYQRVKANRFANLDASEGVQTLLVVPRDSGTRRLQLPRIDRQLLTNLVPIGLGGWNARIGGRTFRNVHERDGAVMSATEIDETGVIRAVTRDIFGREHERLRLIPSASIETEAIGAMCQWLPVLRQLGFNGGLYLDLAMLNLPLCALALRNNYMSASLGPDHDVTPDVVLAEPDDRRFEKLPHGVAAALRAPLDFMWNEFGIAEGSPHYDANGTWEPGR